MRSNLARLVVALSFLVTALPAAAQTRLLRFPDIHGDRVAFSYAGDVWTAPAAGGTAARLTAHPGQELFPRFSPDGEWIAFTGQYDGDEQVYVVPAGGGVPRQLTWYPATGPLPPRWGYDHQVYDWTPDGKGGPVPLASRYGGPARGPSCTPCSVDGGLPVQLPMRRLGRRRPLARRRQGGLLAAVARLPHLEALPGRLGAGSARSSTSPPAS